MTNVPSASARHASVPRAFPTRIARMPSAVSCNDWFCPYTHKTRSYTTSSAWPCAFNSARFGLTHGPSHHVQFVVKRWTRFVTLVLFLVCALRVWSSTVWYVLRARTYCRLRTHRHHMSYSVSFCSFSLLVFEIFWHSLAWLHCGKWFCVQHHISDDGCDPDSVSLLSSAAEGPHHDERWASNFCYDTVHLRGLPVLRHEDIQQGDYRVGDDDTVLLFRPLLDEVPDNSAGSAATSP